MPVLTLTASHTSAHKMSACKSRVHISVSLENHTQPVVFGGRSNWRWCPVDSRSVQAAFLCEWHLKQQGRAHGHSFSRPLFFLLQVIKNSAIRLCWGRRNTSRLPTLAQPTSNYILPLPWANPPLPTYTGEGPSLPPMYDTSAMLPLSLQMYQQAGLGPGPGPGPGPGYPAHPPHYSSQVKSATWRLSIKAGVLEVGVFHAVPTILALHCMAWGLWSAVPSKLSFNSGNCKRMSDAAVFTQPNLCNLLSGVPDLQVGSSHSFAPEGQGGLQARGQAEQQSMSDALQAFAELQLNQPAMSGPYSL